METESKLMVFLEEATTEAETIENKIELLLATTKAKEIFSEWIKMAMWWAIFNSFKNTATSQERKDKFANLFTFLFEKVKAREDFPISLGEEPGDMSNVLTEEKWKEFFNLLMERYKEESLKEIEEFEIVSPEGNHLEFLALT